MTSYKDAFPSLDKFEGGLVFIKSEGQWTNKGIQFTTYQSLCFQLLKVLPTYEHFKRLTRAEWGKFVQYYWNIATNNNSIIIKQTAVVVFTAYWASGNRGLQILQTAMNKTYNLNLREDGIIGDQTTQAINRHRTSAKTLFTALSDYWNDLSSRPKWAAFKNGWNNRLAFIAPEGGGFPIIAGILFLTFLLFKIKQ